MNASRRLINKVVDRLGDRMYGIRTHSYASAKSLGYVAPELNDYAPVPYLELRQIFKAIPEELLKGAFVDYGCGLGRVLIVAHRLGFAHVIGVELAESLVAGGRENLKSFNRCEIVHSDAALYEVPASASVFFFGNPFGGKFLQDTLLRVADSVRTTPRPHLLVGYNNADKLPKAAEAAGIRLRRLELHYPKSGKVWATWVLE